MHLGSRGVCKSNPSGDKVLPLGFSSNPSGRIKILANGSAWVGVYVFVGVWAGIRLHVHVILFYVLTEDPLSTGLDMSGILNLQAHYDFTCGLWLFSSQSSTHIVRLFKASLNAWVCVMPGGCRICSAQEGNVAPFQPWPWERSCHRWLLMQLQLEAVLEIKVRLSSEMQ